MSPGSSRFFQQAADLAAHNAVQGQVVEQLRVQLANAQAQLQATQAEVQGLSRAAAAAADAAATAGDREEIDRRATNLTVSNLTGVTSETEAAKVCGKLLQHLDGQTQPEIMIYDQHRTFGKSTRKEPDGLISPISSKFSNFEDATFSADDQRHISNSFTLYPKP